MSSLQNSTPLFLVDGSICKSEFLTKQIDLDLGTSAVSYVTEMIWNHNFYLPPVRHLSSDLKVFPMDTLRSKTKKDAKMKRSTVAFQLSQSKNQFAVETTI